MLSLHPPENAVISSQPSTELLTNRLNADMTGIPGILSQKPHGYSAHRGLRPLRLITGQVGASGKTFHRT
jgi:hypothetical protein